MINNIKERSSVCVCIIIIRYGQENRQRWSSRRPVPPPLFAVVTGNRDGWDGGPGAGGRHCHQAVTGQIPIRQRPLETHRARSLPPLPPTPPPPPPPQGADTGKNYVFFLNLTYDLSYHDRRGGSQGGDRFGIVVPREAQCQNCEKRIKIKPPPQKKKII